jgi:hypothetical protein
MNARLREIPGQVPWLGCGSRPVAGCTRPTYLSNRLYRLKSELLQDMLQAGHRQNIEVGCMKAGLSRERRRFKLGTKGQYRR